MIDFSSKTYRTLLQTMLDKVPGSLDKREGSLIQTALGAGAYALEDFYLYLDRTQAGAFLQTAQGSDLDLLSVIANVSRYPASAAIRLGVFDLDTLPAGARFSTVDGAESVNFSLGEQIGPGRYQMVCETPGTIGNCYTGPILPITVVEGLGSAQIADILIPGDDTEGDEALRARAIAALNERPFGGNIADYKRVVSAIDGVGAVQIYPAWNGGGTVKLSLLGADWAPASEQLIEKTQIAVDPPPNQGLGYGTAPIGAKVAVTAPETVSVNVTAALIPAAGYDIEQLKPLARQALENYLLSVRQNWATPDAGGLTSYSCAVYLARTAAALLQAPGVVNVADVTINGQAEDLILAETGTLQQVPILGEAIFLARD